MKEEEVFNLLLLIHEIIVFNGECFRTSIRIKLYIKRKLKIIQIE
jgi:hypothetical protein